MSDDPDYWTNKYRPDADGTFPPEYFQQEGYRQKWVTTGEGITLHSPQQCNFCIHLWRDEPGRKKCTAFPEGVPTPILLNDHDHRYPWPGDDGVVFEQDEDEREFIFERDRLGHDVDVVTPLDNLVEAEWLQARSGEGEHGDGSSDEDDA